MPIIATTEKTRYGDGGVCAICRRRSDGIGVFLKRPDRIVWACYEHMRLVKKAAYMPTKEFEIEERDAIRNGTSQAAGEYLDKIGKSDFGDMTEDEWHEFLRVVVVGFGKALQKEILEYKAPF